MPSEIGDLVEYIATKGYQPKNAPGAEVRYPCFFVCGEQPSSKKRKLYVNTEEGFYHCKVCDTRGGTTLLLRHFGDEDKAATAMPGANPAERRRILDEATTAASKWLWGDDDTLLYLLNERGLSPETIEERRLGRVKGRMSLSGAAGQAERRDLEGTGLVYRDGPRAGQDFFYDHILIPYISRGQVVQMRGKVPRGKYMTGPGEAVRLFNTDSLDDADDVIVTEGEFDAMVLEQHLKGSPDDNARRVGVVGLAGTGAFPANLESYFEHARRVFIGFDPDDAGKRAAVKLKEMLGSRARILELPEQLPKCDWTEYLLPIPEGADDEWLAKHPHAGHTWRDVVDLMGSASGKRLFSMTEAGVRWRNQRNAGQGLQLGWRELDQAITPGMKPGQLCVLLAKTGCMAGDTEIAVNRGGKGFGITLAEMFKRWTGERYAWDHSIPTYCQRADGESVRLGRVEDVWQSGVKQTYSVTTESGRTVRGTDEHPFLTSEGWRRLDELEPGDEVLVNGGKSSNGRSRKPHYYIRSGLAHHPFAGRRNVRAGGTSVPLHRLVAEAELSGIEVEELIERCRSGAVAGLTFLDPQQWSVHHIDGDPHNNEPGNLKVLTPSEHHRLHASETGANVLDRVLAERVVSIEAHGEEMTYDIAMADAPHNFMASGFAVHNSGKTILLCNIAYNARSVPTMFISLEQTQEEVYERLRRIHLFHSPRDSEAMVDQAFDQLRICEENRLSEKDMAMLIEEFEIEVGVPPELVLVDYLGYYAKGIRGNTPYEKTSNAVMQLKAEAKNHRAIVIAPHQVSRIAKEGKPISLDDARDSGVVEETADFLFSAYRPDDALREDANAQPTGKIRLEVNKSRHGGKGRITTLLMDPLTLAIVDAQGPNGRRVEHHNHLAWRGETYEDLRRKETEPTQERMGIA